MVDDVAQRTATPNAALVPRQPLWMRLGRQLQPMVNRIVANGSQVADRPVHDVRDFPWVAALEDHWIEIQREAAAALHDLETVPPLAEISPDHRDIAPPKKWRSFFLYGYGYREEANIRRCPRTDALLRAVPGLNSAFFSVLAPGTHIPPHVGVTKAIMTCHLGLSVPRDEARCWMRVVDHRLHWQAGRALIFDDTFEHEVANDTNETRVVLLIQFRRPVRASGRVIGGLFLWAVRRSRFVQDARRSVRDWTARG
ncbi:aspartyl/asparaginyl beta-hydroxylase domain-containing protein [Sphingomonas crusticola]|uniref:aspartyl/asparaginyl beta-hydroxylase domain-containing protein n=1 Tax=Sphingomonas crusticola TaxID=1697973 RepID=UPI000E2511EA|nr:aspartyl/asparaginyl beta-hydroxylase domain-containing protein [Sphingomonas crusticola]